MRSCGKRRLWSQSWGDKWMARRGNSSKFGVKITIVMIGPNQNPKVPRKTQITTVHSQAIETIMQWKSADKWDPMKKADSQKCHKISSRQSLGQDQLILTARASGFSRDQVVMFLTPSTIIILETRGTVTVTSVMTTAGLWSQSVVPGQGEASFLPPSPSYSPCSRSSRSRDSRSRSRSQVRGFDITGGQGQRYSQTGVTHRDKPRWEVVNTDI